MPVSVFLHKTTKRAHTEYGVSALNNEKENRPGRMPCLRLEPEKRLCPIFDDVAVATFPVAPPEKMGFRVLDDCCEEHIQ